MCFVCIVCIVWRVVFVVGGTLDGNYKTAQLVRSKVLRLLPSIHLSNPHPAIASHSEADSRVTGSHPRPLIGQSPGPRLACPILTNYVSSTHSEMSVDSFCLRVDRAEGDPRVTPGRKRP